MAQSWNGEVSNLLFEKKNKDEAMYHFFCSRNAEMSGVTGKSWANISPLRRIATTNEQVKKNSPDAAVKYYMQAHIFDIKERIYI